MSARAALFGFIQAGAEEGDLPTFAAAVDAYRAEVLNEGADVANQVSRADAEAGNPAGARAAQAVEVKLRRLAGRATKQRRSGVDPDFFEPGRTYTEPDGSTDWAFRVDTITTHPEDGERTALGWRHFRGEWTECAYGEDDFDIHLIADAIAITKDGAS